MMIISAFWIREEPHRVENGENMMNLVSSSQSLAFFCL